MPIDPTELTKSIGGLGTLDPEHDWPRPCRRRGDSFTSFAVPRLSLALVLGLRALAGVLAAVRPAHRAARTNVLSAIATE